MIELTKLVLFLFCTYLQFQIYPINASGIALMLLSFLLSILPIIIRDDYKDGVILRHTTCIFWGIFLCFTPFFPACRMYIPLSIMDLFRYRFFLPMLPGILSVLFLEEPKRMVILLLLSALSAVMEHLLFQNLQLKYDLKKLRDTSKEHAILIEEKNQQLIAKQDADIYAATLKERNRIAREIHDNVGHMLTRSILQIGAIRTINQNDTLKAPLDGLLDTLNSAMTNIRSSVHDLHDESIHLETALHEIIDPIKDLTICLQYDMSPSVPRNIKYCMISITKEAVNNTLKHSNATRMELSVQEHPAFYQLLIADNGTNADVRVNEGIGLTNMRDRIRSLNGTINITTDHGFQIIITIIKNRSFEEE